MQLAPMFANSPLSSQVVYRILIWNQREKVGFTWECDGTYPVERQREVSGFSSLFSPCAICLITRCYPAFDQSAWLHYLRQRKAAAFSCITQKQGVMSNETRKKGSNPARGKSLTRYCSVLFLDGPHSAALFAATRHAPGEVPFPIGREQNSNRQKFHMIQRRHKHEAPRR